jgi:hypothetical protein
MTGRGIFGRGMGNRPCRELFLCRTFLCRFLLETTVPSACSANRPDKPPARATVLLTPAGNGLVVELFQPRTAPSANKATSPLRPEEIPMTLVNPGGTGNAPGPHATTVPFACSARFSLGPAEMATTFERPLGTFVIPPQLTTVPSLRGAILNHDVPARARQPPRHGRPAENEECLRSPDPVSPGHVPPRGSAAKWLHPRRRPNLACGPCKHHDPRPGTNRTLEPPGSDPISVSPVRLQGDFNVMLMRHLRAVGHARANILLLQLRVVL